MPNQKNILDNPDSEEYRIRKALCDRALDLIGIPYIWGGNDPNEGLDCSGLVVHCMRWVGLIPNTADYTAQRLYEKCDRFTGVARVMPGDLVFYGRSPHSITHVTMAIGFDRVIGASRGDRTITNADIARARKACVAILDFDYRTSDRIGYGRIWNWSDDE